MAKQADFEAATDKLVHGLLRDALGFTVEGKIPGYRGIVGYMVEAPLLWIKHSRFPILFVAYKGNRTDILADLVKQMEMAKAGEHFALLIVVPASNGTGNEAEEVRLAVNDSVYHHDFIVLDREHLASIIAQNSSSRLIEIILEQGVELSRLSPYVVYGPVPANMFFGREKELKEVSQGLPQTSYALVGGRRIGKSSTLQSLGRLLNRDPRYLAHYLNVEAASNYAEFYKIVASSIPSLGAPAAGPDIRDLVNTLKESADGRNLVFLVDEIDALLDSDAAEGGRLFKTLRGLSHEHVCSFVFTGSKTLHHHLHDAASPFFNFCKDLALRPLAPRSVAEIVRKPLQQLGFELVDEERLIDSVIDLTSCHPSLVQWLCDALIRGAEKRVIRVEDLARTAGSAAFRQYFIETAWGVATPLEKLVSLLPRTPQFGFDEVASVASRYGLRDRTALREALATLELYALLERTGDRYRFVLTHFSQIVRATEDPGALIQGWLRQIKLEA